MDADTALLMILFIISISSRKFSMNSIGSHLSSVAISCSRMYFRNVRVACAEKHRSRYDVDALIVIALAHFCTHGHVQH